MRICWLEARGYRNVGQVWPRGPQPYYETSCIMQMKGNARAAENWDTRQALLRELVPGQSRSASPLPFLIRTFFFLLSSPSSSFKRAREGDRGWKFLKEKVIRSRSKDSLDWFSSPEKSMRRGGRRRKRISFFVSIRGTRMIQEWFGLQRSRKHIVSSFIYLFLFFFNPRTTFWNYTLKGGGKKKKRGKKNLGIGSRRSFHSRLYHLSFQFAFVTILIPFSVRV